MTEALEIRVATPDEYAAVGALTLEAYEADGPVAEGYAAELADAGARARAGVLLVARDTAGALVGTAALVSAEAGPRWAEGAAEGEAVLRMLAVAAAARRRGVGRALTIDCIARATAAGARRLRLLTRPSMTAAQALYRQLGFRRDPTGDVEPRPGIPLLCFVLDLGGG